MAFRTAGTLAGVLVAGVAVASIFMNPVVTLSGLTRPVENIGTESCIIESCECMVSYYLQNVTYICYSALQACESMFS
jgi:hypothetical protein